MFFLAWQEVIEQEEGNQRLEVSQRAVYYKETTPGPHMDGEYGRLSSSFCFTSYVAETVTVVRLEAALGVELGLN